MRTPSCRFCFVYMSDERDAERACRKLNGLEVGRRRRPLNVQWAKVSAPAPTPARPRTKLLLRFCVCVCVALLLSLWRRPDVRVAEWLLRAAQTKDADRKRDTRPSSTLFVVNFDTARTRERDLERHFEQYGASACPQGLRALGRSARRRRSRAATSRRARLPRRHAAARRPHQARGDQKGAPHVPSRPLAPRALPRVCLLSSPARWKRERWRLTRALACVRVLCVLCAQAYAFIQFERVEDAKYALEKTHLTMIDGRTVTVRTLGQPRVGVASQPDRFLHDRARVAPI